MTGRTLPLLALLAPWAAQAAAPALVPVTGYLTDATGAPINDQVTLHLTLYTAATGNALVWEETQDVDIDNGQFTAYLGEQAALDLVTFADNPVLYLGIAVDTGAEMTPRFQVATAPFAAYAQYCDDAATVGGIDPAELQLTTDAVDWTNLTGVPTGLNDGDQDTTYSNGTGLTLSGARQFAVDQTVIDGWARAIAYDSLAELRTDLDAIYVAKQACTVGQLLASDGAGGWACADSSTGAVTALTTRVTAAETAITTTQTNLATTQTNLATAQTALGTAQTNIATAQSNITALNTSISTITSNATALAGRVTATEAALALYGGTSATDSAPSCLAIKTAHPTAPDGTYYLNPFKASDATLSFRAYCLMSRAGGGWTKIAQYDNVTDLSPAAGVNANGTWTAGTTGAGKLSNAAISSMWSRTRFMLRMASPSDSLLMGNGAGYLIFAGHFPDFGVGHRPGVVPYSLYCEQTGDDVIDKQQNYSTDPRTDCAYGNYWLYDHNYTGDPQCYGFSPTKFTANLHFCGTTSTTSAGGVTGITQVFVRD